MMNMPPVTKNLIIINLLFFLAKLVAVRYGVDLDNLLGLHFFLAPDFNFYQFFTYMFMHGGVTHILFNMFAVWMFGRVMESYWGGRRFLLYYVVCGLGAGLVQEGVQYVQYLWQGLGAYDTVNIGYTVISMGDYLNRWTTIGASGAVYGILLAFGMSFPNERLFIFPLPVPIKAKFFVIGYAVIELLSALGNSGDGVAAFRPSRRNDIRFVAHLVLAEKQRWRILWQSDIRCRTLEEMVCRRTRPVFFLSEA